MDRDETKWFGAVIAVLILLPLLNGCDKNPTGMTRTDRSSNDKSFAVVHIDIQKANLTLHWQDPDGQPFVKFANLERFLNKQGKTLLFATNAGIFTESRTPLGAHIEQHRVLVDVNRDRGEGNFYLLPNGVFFIDAQGPHVVATEQFQIREDIRLATQSGPLLVNQGQIHPAFKPDSTNQFIRSGVGVKADGQVVFAISEQPVTFHEFAMFFKDDLGCPNALYLDGGISKFHAPAWDRPETWGDYAGIFAVTR